MKRFLRNVVNDFDIRDFLLICGWGMIGYGIRLKYGLWLSFIICGSLLMLVAYLMIGRPPHDRKPYDST
jgi:hypothetical protein